MKLSIENVKELVKLAWDTQSDPEVESIIPNLIGCRGIGKTAIIKQAVNELIPNSVVITFVGSGSASEDLGICVPNKDTGLLDLYHTGRLTGHVDEAKDASCIVIFLDEIDKYSVDVQAVLLTVLQDRHFNGIPVDPRVVYITASNPEGLGGNTLIEPLADRLCEVKVEPDADAWCDWAVSRGIHESIIGFIQWQCSEQNNTRVFSSYSEDIEGPQPSARSWAKISPALHSNAPIEIKREIVLGYVGRTVASEFFEFEKIYLNDAPPRIDDIIENPDTAKVPTHPGTVFAVASLIIQYVASKGSNATSKDAIKTFVVNSLITYLERFENEAHRVWAIKSCAKANKLFRENKSDVFSKYE